MNLFTFKLFIQITSVEENFNQIRRMKLKDDWLALSKAMKVKISNLKSQKYLKFLFLEKDGLLFHFSIVSNSLKNIQNESIQNSIIDRIKIK